jgi:hypothetical protein
MALLASGGCSKLWNFNTADTIKTTSPVASPLIDFVTDSVTDGATDSAACPVCPCENPTLWLSSGCDLSCGAKCGDTCCCVVGSGACGCSLPQTSCCCDGGPDDALCPPTSAGGNSHGATCCTKDYHYKEHPGMTGGNSCENNCDCDGMRYCDTVARDQQGSGACAGVAR